MALAAVLSKVVAPLSIQCLLLFPFFVGVFSLFSNTAFTVLSNFEIISLRKRELVA